MSDPEQHENREGPLEFDRDRAVQTWHLTKKFNDTVAVDDLSFTVPVGTVFGFIGPSGCGKTTTIRLLTGHYRPTSGRAWVLGSEPQDFDQTIKARIGYMPQDFVLYPHLSIQQNLRFASSIYGEGRHSREVQRKLLDLFLLQEHRHKRVTQISGGMRRRLSLAATLLHNPTLLFLDEPTAGIDPVLRERLWEHFRSLREQGRTLFVTTQYVGEAAYCDLVAVMSQGRMLMVDTPEGLRRRALGGEVLDVRLANSLNIAAEEELANLPGVRRMRRVQPRAYQVVTEDAAKAIPILMRALETQGAQVESIDEVQTPFDDVFVKLVEDSTTDHE